MKRYRWTLAAALLAALLALGVSGCRNDGGPATDSETDGTGSVTEPASTAVASETPTEDPTETTESATTIPEEMTIAPYRNTVRYRGRKDFVHRPAGRGRDRRLPRRAGLAVRRHG